MEKYVVWGAGEHTRLLLDNFLGLKDHVEVFLDKDSRKKELNGIPVLEPSAWTQYEEFIIVICVKNNFHEIFNELVCKYHCRKTNIVSSH